MWFKILHTQYHNMYLEIAVVFLFIWLINKVTCGMSDSVTCLQGKIAVVTGGNSGIGYQISLLLASKGCKVIVAARNISEELKQKLITESSNPNIIVKYLDLNSFKSVKAFAEEINKTEKHLDILIHNSGAGALEQKLSEDGFNNIMQTNFLGPFLLSHLLLDLLKKSGGARMIFTSSCMAFTHNFHPKKQFHFDRILKTHPLIQYSCTKVLNIIGADHLAEKFREYGIMVNSVHPGIVKTPIYQKGVDVVDNKAKLYGIAGWLLYFFVFVFGKTPFEGAQTTFHVATSKKLENVTGKFFMDCRPMFKPFITQNQELCSKLMNESYACCLKN